ncbi:MAG: GNAT family N-acetyltransferase [Euryarchaeota archaeon]|nr:GNAT family N-acetyltransferase [Euryarchaeota archaeon]
MKKLNNSLIFREITNRDIDELYEILNTLSNNAKHFFHPHPFDRQTLVDICSSKKDHYFVLIADKKIIGYSFLRLFQYTIPSFGCCIRSEYEHRGYGKMLTQWTINKAKELGYKKVILKVYPNNDAAFRIYQKSGFKIAGKDEDSGQIKMSLVLE